MYFSILNVSQHSCKDDNENGMEWFLFAMMPEDLFLFIDSIATKEYIPVLDKILWYFFNIILHRHAPRTCIIDFDSLASSSSLNEYSRKPTMGKYTILREKFCDAH